MGVSDVSPETVSLLQTAVTAAFAAGGAYVAVRAELKFLWHSVREQGSRIERIENLLLREGA